MKDIFRLKEHKTNVRTEILAGFTTFITMAYIIFVNPQILSATGMDFGAVTVATILAAAIATLIMGFVANVPFAQAPGMGLNAFFTFTVVFAMGFTWQQALAIVFICGIVNILITVTKIRKLFVSAIPESLQFAISAGIGLFIAYIGFKQGGFFSFTVEGFNVVANLPDGGVVGKDIIPDLVKFTSPFSQLALIGLVITVALMLFKVKGAILIGILATTVIGAFMGVTDASLLKGMEFKIPSLKPTFLKLDFNLFKDGKVFLAITAILAFSLSDTFDTVGTFLGTGRKTGVFSKEDVETLKNSKGFKSKLDRALFADATATSMGALLGTSNTTTYIESAAGINVGGKTGLTSVVTAALFLAFLFIAPAAKVVPFAATAPALIIVGIMMMSTVKSIKWDDFSEALPAFMTIVMMPFTYSISHGVAVGFIFYCLTKIIKGEAKKVHPLMYIFTGLFVASFVFTAIV
jgi:AGZA family xanthine/uracil permease-like MFS transporter